MPGPNGGNHVVVKDGKFHALVSELTDGNYVIVRLGDRVYGTKAEAIDAALNEGLENKAGEEWLHE